MKKKWIDGLTVVVTGASSGLGREIAKKLIVNNSCKVIGIGRSEEKMIAFKKSLGDYSDKFEYHLFDVSVEENWSNFEKSLNTDIDVIINNAGILPPFQNFANLSKTSKEMFKDGKTESECQNIEKTMKINFFSVVYACHYLCPHIEKNKTPAIINISSSAGLCTLPGISMYSASKSAVKNFTETLMLEKDYYVGLVCPGFTKTDIFRNQKNTELPFSFGSTLDKMSNKIYKGIIKKKRKMVFGFDAKAMDKMNRYFPRKGIFLLKKVMKKQKLDLFKEVF